MRTIPSPCSAAARRAHSPIRRTGGSGMPIASAERVRRSRCSASPNGRPRYEQNASKQPSPRPTIGSKMEMEGGAGFPLR